MRVRQIGSTVFDNNTNIVVNATALDAVGGGFRVDDLYGPQPFSIEIAFIRSTRQLALNALNSFSSDIYLRSRRRTFLNVAAGTEVFIEDESGNVTLRSLLTNISVNLLSIETTNTGVVARVRVIGTLVGPFTATTFTGQSVSSLKPYELRKITLTNITDSVLAAHGFYASVSNSNGVRNALLVFETLENSVATSRIYRKNPTSVSSNLVLESFDAGDTTLQRARFNTSGNGTITYTISAYTLVPVVFNLFFEVYLPSAPTSDVFYTISWDQQPAITGIVDFARTFIKAGVYTLGSGPATVTIQITNAPANTYISPLVFIPLDGVFVYNATATNLNEFRALNATTEITQALYAAGNGYGEMRGQPGFIAGKYLAVFCGMMSSTITNLSASVNFVSNRIEPASFM
jgi:hypothetical protein